MIKAGDFVVVSSGSLEETDFNPDVKRKVFLHTPSGQLRIYDDDELNGKTGKEEGWWIDGFAIRDFVKKVEG